MALFGKRKVSSSDKDRNSRETKPILRDNKTIHENGIKILGSGCSKCNALESVVKEALAELGMTESIDHITDFSKIASYGVMSTPALVIDGTVAAYGKVLKKDEAISIIRQYRG